MHTENLQNLLPSALDADPAFDPAAADAEAAKEESVEPPAPIEYPNYTSEQLQSAVEAVLFLHHKPVSLAKMRELIHPGVEEEEYRSAISNLMSHYFAESRGVEIVEVANGFQFRTKVEHKEIVRRMFQIAPMKLTNAMLEVLAIVAYNQPITKDGIEKIRGVDSSHLLRALMEKKMLRIAGKSDELGRPMLYATTREFLELFGLRDLSALPSLREIEEMLPQNEVGPVSEEEALAVEMEGIVASSKPLEFNDLELEEEFEDGSQGIEKRETGTQNARTLAEALSAQADGNRSQASYGGQAPDAEIDGALDLEAEAPRHLPFGPEGNA